MGPVNPAAVPGRIPVPPRIHGEGTSAARWRAWEPLRHLPRCEAGELVPEHARAVVLAPHPDDEVLGTGGLLHQLACLRRALMLVAVTDGEASHPGSSAWPPETLLQVRPAERELALRRLGVQHARLLRAGFPDGGLAAHEDELRHLLLHHLRPGDIVFATWCADGHPDHEATGRAARAAALQRGACFYEVPIWGWHWAEPADPRVPWQRAFRVPLDPAARHAKRHALRAFRSQTEPDPSTGRAPVLPPRTLGRWLGNAEVFFR